MKPSSVSLCLSFSVITLHLHQWVLARNDGHVTSAKERWWKELLLAATQPLQSLHCGRRGSRINTSIEVAKNFFLQGYLLLETKGNAGPPRIPGDVRTTEASALLFAPPH